ncbi:uncharacterized protein BCR38DRAFT_411311 [Pseudomassariella vexata]|uniref:2EXR domain-containing protein n=1 Tax=Pseudomassariella vexata TaxID=1141098 RepID=A0A1Y2DQ72_9PEZI|nr:uncharacterized protein BCR38DRAFT_411311 [Pseudomassariella vexata]ORY61438.1 hypothetical protein BCR38DRAFT_411311 [Pseudomassariella vexata]
MARDSDHPVAIAPEQGEGTAKSQSETSRVIQIDPEEHENVTKEAFHSGSEETDDEVKKVDGIDAEGDKEVGDGAEDGYEQDDKDSWESGSIEDARDSFLDIEAAESDGVSDGSEYAEELYSFPQFCRLPIELRHRVWAFFDPDMRAKARVYDFQVFKHRESSIWESATILQQTAPARAVLAAHRESRELALKFYPDALEFRPGYVTLRFRKSRDVILLSGITEPEDLLDIRPFLKDVEHVAIDADVDLPPDYALKEFMQSMKHLKALYLCREATEFPHPYRMRWCAASQEIHSFRVAWTEEDSGLHEDIESLYCWPNLVDHPEFMKNEKGNGNAHNEDESNHEEMGDDEIDEDELSPLKVLNSDGVALWSMYRFSFDEGLRLYGKIERTAAMPGNWRDNWKSDSDLELDDEGGFDEYESDGIDDETIDSDAESAEEDDLMVQEVSGEDDFDASSTFNGFSPLRDATPDDVQRQQPEANFSSLEPESPDARESDQASLDREPTRKRKRANRRVVDSDSEDGDTADEDRSPPRRRARIRIESDDDDDDEQPPAPKRQSRIVSDDSKDEEQPATRKRPAQAAPDGSDDSDDEEQPAVSKGRAFIYTDPAVYDDISEEEASEEPEAKPMSIFEKLQLYRSQNPIDDDESGSDPDTAEVGMDNYDSGNYADFQDDEEDDGEIENDAVLDLAEKSDGDGGW